MVQPKTKFNPASLSQKEQEAVIELYLGLHPEYFIYDDALSLRADIDRAHLDKKNFNGFRPMMRRMGHEV